MEQIPKFKSTKWQAERRRAEHAINDYLGLFLSEAKAGLHEQADRSYENIIQALDEMLMLAGAERE